MSCNVRGLISKFLSIVILSFVCFYGYLLVRQPVSRNLVNEKVDKGSLAPRVPWEYVGSSPEPKPYFTTVAAITSGYGENAQELRRAIRETWLTVPGNSKATNSTLVHKFILGRCLSDTRVCRDAGHIAAVEAEAAQHGDMVFLDFQDTYRNLTVKTLAAMGFFLSNYEFDFFMKIDDDVYIQLDFWMRLQPELRKIKFAWGHISGVYVAHRDPSSQWALTVEEFPGKRNLSHPPAHLHGPCYILSKDVIEAFVRRSLEPDFVPIFIEDVNTSVMLVELGFNPDNSYIFHTGCPCNDDPSKDDCLLARHKCQPNDIRRIHEVRLLGHEAPRACITDERELPKYEWLLQ